MLNKPIVLTIIISVVFFVTAIVSSAINNGLYQYILSLIIIFCFSLYLGYSQSKTLKEEISKEDKIKISLYFFIFWFLFTFSIVILMLMNTTVKDAPLFYFSKKGIAILTSVFFMNFFLFSIYSSAIYLALSLGCRLGLHRDK